MGDTYDHFEIVWRKSEFLDQAEGGEKGWVLYLFRMFWLYFIENCPQRQIVPFTQSK